MKGAISSLAERLNINILALREHRSEIGFYAPNVDTNIFLFPGITAEKDGIFTNFYPEDTWYEALIKSYLDLKIPAFEKPSLRSESVKRTLFECAKYFGEEIKLPEIKEASGFDGITYNSKAPTDAITEERSYEMTDPAFYLYAASKRAEGASGKELSLSKNGKRLLIAMAFLEADIKRCITRLDTSVLYKRAKKCAEFYFDYYYEGGTDKKEKGLLSQAYFNFSSAIFYLFGSNALQDDRFIV
ncbi:MAG: hypothetical protein Q4G23_11590 [Clostridia bacterium]|nr:hypothetical protein [Clostridia bacterium]